MSNYISVIIIIMLLIVYVYFQVNLTKIHIETIKHERLPKNFKMRVLHITDFHNKKWYKERLLDDLRMINVDLIVLTGDLIDRRTNNLRGVLYFIESLKQINERIYFVRGNHEEENPKREEFISELIEIGVIVLDDIQDIVTIRDLSINILGLRYRENYKRSIKAIDKAEEKNFTIVLSHTPEVAVKQYINADVALCGHTHGGQIRIPVVGAITAPGQGLFPEYSKGQYKIAGGLKLYIDSGAGTSRIPIRFMNKSQVSIIKIVGGKR